MCLNKLSYLKIKKEREGKMIHDPITSIDPRAAPGQLTGNVKQLQEMLISYHEAIKQYGTHKLHCALRPCTCGWEQIVKQLKQMERG